MDRDNKKRESKKGNPTPTGRTFLDLCDQHRRSHPQESGIPHEVQRLYWRAAALANQDNELVEAMDNVDKDRRLKEITSTWAGH